MSSNREKIKSILDDYIDCDNNYKKIKIQIYRKQNRKKFIRKFSVAVSVILFLVSVSFIIGNNKMFNQVNEKKGTNDIPSDNIVINELESVVFDSMFYHFDSTEYNLIDNVKIYKYLEEKDSLKIIIQQIIYNDRHEETYFGGFKYIGDSNEFIYLYITSDKNENFIFKHIFDNTDSSLIDNYKAYIVNCDGIIFIKFIKNDEIYILQTNITDSSVYIDIVKDLIKYQD